MIAFNNSLLEWFHSHESFGTLRTSHITQVLRDSNYCQDTNYNNHNHQFDQGEASLISHDEQPSLKHRAFNLIALDRGRKTNFKNLKTRILHFCGKLSHNNYLTQSNNKTKPVETL